MRRCSFGVYALVLGMTFGLTACGTSAEEKVAVSEQTAASAVSDEEDLLSEENTVAEFSYDTAESSTTTATEELPHTMTFGTYPQQGDTAEPIEWLVADHDENSLLLQILSCLPAVA